MTIKKACVIGAGVMGSGIAAQIANAGVPVLLLDIVPKDADRPQRHRQGRDRQAAEGRSRAVDVQGRRQADHARQYRGRSRAARRRRLDRRGGDRDASTSSRTSIASSRPQRKKGSIVSSNTSTIPLEQLIAGLPDSFARDFCITHFFNPPRYMRLLEVVGGAKTRPEAISGHLRASATRGWARRSSMPRTRPASSPTASASTGCRRRSTAALDLGLTVEEADAIMGRPIGAPKTGIFGLLDLVGLDLMPHVDKTHGGIAAARRCLS